MTDLDLRARRDLIETVPNPSPRLDYVVTLSGQVALHGGPAPIRLRYVPDRLTIDVAAFVRYLETLGTQEWSTLETLATTILEDAIDQTVARWAQVTASAPKAEDGLDHHGVMLEDRQPNWSNPALLARLKAD